MNNGHLEICRECEHGKQRFGGSCFCTLFGIIIGYSKTECRGYSPGEGGTDGQHGRTVETGIKTVEENP